MSTPPGSASVTVAHVVRRSGRASRRRCAPSDCPTKLIRVGSTPTGPAGAACPEQSRGLDRLRQRDQVRLALPQVVAGGERTRQVDEVRARRVDHAVLAGCASGVVHEVDVERALRGADALRLGRRAIQRVRRVGDAVQRQVDGRDDEARVGEAVRHRERVRSVTRDAVLHDGDRPAAGRLARGHAEVAFGIVTRSGTVTSATLAGDRIEHRQVAARRVDPRTGGGRGGPELRQHRGLVVRIGGRRQVIRQLRRADVDVRLAGGRVRTACVVRPVGTISVCCGVGLRR